MTTLTRYSQRNAAPAASGRLTGVGVLIRLALRRERVLLLSWILGIDVVVVSSLSAIKGLYPGAAERAALALGVASNPAVLAVTGPIPGTSVGGLVAWRIGVIGGVLVALMAMSVVIRRTRGDEESGRSELLSSGVVGRAAALTAALAVSWAASLLLGAVVTGAAIGYGENATGAVVFGGSLAGVGLVFGGVAAVAAQLFEGARAASAAVGVLLGVSFGLRAVADIVPQAGFLSWLSPLGWLERGSAFGGNIVAVLLLFPAAAAAATSLALFLLHRRDVGLAFFGAQLGPAANARLRSPTGLALRLHRSALVGWTIGFAAVGALAGGIADSAADLLNGNPKVQQIFEQLGGPGTLAEVFLSALSGIAGLVAGAASISAGLRMAAEETSGRLEPVLATSVGRVRMLASHLLFVLFIPALALLTAGLFAGFLHGLRSGNLSAGLSAGLAAMTIQIPAAVVMGTLAVALVGLAPKLVMLAWAALAIALLLGQLGNLLGLPRALMNLSPYTHVPLLPAVGMDWTATLGLLVVAALLAAAGAGGMRFRDVG